ncbi:hypothetical protein [Streptomyces sp. NPDC002851]
MGDVEADLGRIRECARALNRIHRTFTHDANPALCYSQSALGSDQIVDVFSEFSSNWEIHRKKLVEELEGLAKLTKAAAKGFEKIDTDLANALRKADKAHKKGEG